MSHSSARLMMGSLIVCTFVLTPSATAQVVDRDPEHLSETISPFVDRQTIFVGHVDLTKIDIAAALEFMTRTLMPGAERDSIQQQGEMPAAVLSEMRRQLEDAGADELFLSLSIADLANQRFNVIIPVSRDGDPDAVSALLSEVGAFEVCAQVDDVVFCGSKSTREKLPFAKTAQVDRVTLVNAFREAGNAAVKILVLPQDSLRVLEEMDPKLPRLVGDFSGADLARGARWISLGIAPPPNLGLRATVESLDEEAATKLQSAIAKALNWVASRPEVLGMLPEADTVAGHLTPVSKANQLVINIDDETAQRLISTLLRSVSAPLGLQSRNARSTRQLRMLALSMLNFESTYGSFAPSASYDDDGKKLLSWRVYMLPFLEQSALYEQFRLDEPWDSPHNRTLISKMPETFLSRGLESVREGKTGYLLPDAEGTSFHGPEGTRLRDITDGTSKTIMIAESAPEHAVIWTKPDDWQVDLTKPTAGLVNQADDKLTFAFCDGSVQSFPVTIDQEQLRRLLLRNDGQPVDR